jgi:hypothetical protein
MAAKPKGGKRPGAGRKSMAYETNLKADLDECFTRADRKACIRQMVRDCKSKVFQVRHESRKILLAYTYGKPKETVEHGGEGGGPITVKVVYETK